MKAVLYMKIVSVICFDIEVMPVGYRFLYIDVYK